MYVYPQFNLLWSLVDFLKIKGRDFKDISQIRVVTGILYLTGSIVWSLFCGDSSAGLVFRLRPIRSRLLTLSLADSITLQTNQTITSNFLHWLHGMLSQNNSYSWTSKKYFHCLEQTINQSGDLVQYSTWTWTRHRQPRSVEDWQWYKM